jgi:hypothetical protein
MAQLISREDPLECLPLFLREARLHDFFEHKFWDGREDHIDVYKWIIVQLVGKKLYLCYDRWEYSFHGKGFCINPQSLYLPSENHLLAPLGTHLTQEEITAYKKEKTENILLVLQNLIHHLPFVPTENEQEELRRVYRDEIFPFVISTFVWYQNITSKKDPWNTWGGRSIAHAANCNNYGVRKRKRENDTKEE